MSDAKIPREGEYQKGQLWFTRRGNVLTIGLTSSAITELGDVESVELPEEGDVFEIGDVLATVDGNRTSIEVSAPSKGTIQEVNAAATDPAVVAEDPLEEGWLVKLEIEELEDLVELE